MRKVKISDLKRLLLDLYKPGNDSERSNALEHAVAELLKIEIDRQRGE